MIIFIKDNLDSMYKLNIKLKSILKLEKHIKSINDYHLKKI